MSESLLRMEWTGLDLGTWNEWEKVTTELAVILRGAFLIECDAVMVVNAQVVIRLLESRGLWWRQI